MAKIKIFFTSVLLGMICLKATSQMLPVDTILYNGDKNKLLNIVIMGDGYTAAEQGQYITDATAIKNYFFSQAPFSNYRNYFNVFAIEVPSNESGANHPGTSSDSDCPPVPVMTADNYFGSSFDSYGIHRLVCIEHYDSAYYVLSDNFPMYDIVLIVVNSQYYGGSGGTYAVSTTNSNSGDVSVHEIGHSFGELQDEYWNGSPYEAPNMTQDNNPSTIDWKNWLYDNGVGIYAFSEDASWFRPHQGCKMRMLNVPFCSVCSETLIERIHSLVNPVYDYSPVNGSAIVTDTALLNFSLDLLKPIPNTLKTQWSADGNIVSTNTDSFQMDADTLTLGNHSLTATIIDTTLLTRSDNHWTAHLYEIVWDITKTVVGINTNAQLNTFDVMVYPNPFSENINLSYYISTASAVTIDIIGTDGKVVKKVLDKKQDKGNYTITIESSEFQSTGSYVARLCFGDHVMTVPLIKM